MEEQENTRGVASGSERPFSGNAIHIYRLKGDVIGNGPNCPHLIEALTPFGPSDGSRFRA
jgi:hypothetical protein